MSETCMHISDAARALGKLAHRPRPDALLCARILRLRMDADAYRSQPCAFRPEGSAGADVTLWPEIAR